MGKTNAGLIGLYSPHAGCGKSTAALLVQDIYAKAGRRSRLLPFAEPIRLAASALIEQMGLTDAQATKAVYEDKDKPITALAGRTGRDFLVHVGQGARTFVRPTIWCDLAMSKADKFIAEGTSIVIDDVRMPFEVEAIHQRGGKVFLVTRDVGLCGVRRATTATAQTVEGLLEDLEPDAAILNNGTLSDLRVKVGRAMRACGAVS